MKSVFDAHIAVYIYALLMPTPVEQKCIRMWTCQWCESTLNLSHFIVQRFITKFAWEKSKSIYISFFAISHDYDSEEMCNNVAPSLLGINPSVYRKKKPVKYGQKIIPSTLKQNIFHKFKPLKGIKKRWELYNFYVFLLKSKYFLTNKHKKCVILFLSLYRFCM